MTDADANTDTGARRERKILVVIDDSPETQLAMYYAARRARHTHGRVSLLHIIEPSTFEHWVAVEETIRSEAYDKAESLLRRCAESTWEESQRMPEVHIVEGKMRDVLRDTIQNDPAISVVVVGASAEKDGPGPLVSALTTNADYLGSRPIPISIIPGAMTREDIRQVA